MKLPTDDGRANSVDSCDLGVAQALHLSQQPRGPLEPRQLEKGSVHRLPQLHCRCQVRRLVRRRRRESFQEPVVDRDGSSSSPVAAALVGDQAEEPGAQRCLTTESVELEPGFRHGFLDGVLSRLVVGVEHAERIAVQRGSVTPEDLRECLPVAKARPPSQHLVGAVAESKRDYGRVIGGQGRTLSCYGASGV